MCCVSRHPTPHAIACGEFQSATATRKCIAVLAVRSYAKNFLPQLCSCMLGFRYTRTLCSKQLSPKDGLYSFFAAQIPNAVSQSLSNNPVPIAYKTLSAFMRTKGNEADDPREFPGGVNPRLGIPVAFSTGSCRGGSRRTAGLERCGWPAGFPEEPHFHPVLPLRHLPASPPFLPAAKLSKKNSKKP